MSENVNTAKSISELAFDDQSPSAKVIAMTLDAFYLDMRKDLLSEVGNIERFLIGG